MWDRAAECNAGKRRLRLLFFDGMTAAVACSSTVLQCAICPAPGCSAPYGHQTICARPIIRGTVTMEQRVVRQTPFTEYL